MTGPAPAGPGGTGPAGAEGRWWRLSGDPGRDTPLIRRAAEVLRRGGLVAFPTETVYGLGADALNPAAVARIFAAKGRPPDNPLIVHVADPQGAGPELVAAWPPAARRLAEAFWPGPLTLVVPAGPGVPAAVTAGLPTVAVRCPDHHVARALIAAAGTPVAAPSANRSGRPSATRAEDVWEDLGEHLDVLLDAGPVPVGVESTVVDVVSSPPRLLRPGGIPVEDLEAVLGEAVAAPPPVTAGQAPPSPGMKYRHYAPRAPLILLAGPAGGDEAVAALRRAVAAGERVVLVGCGEDLDALAAAAGISLRRADPLDPAGPAAAEAAPAGRAAPARAGDPAPAGVAGAVSGGPEARAAMGRRIHGAGEAAAPPAGGSGILALDLGPRHRSEEQARRLFRALRAADAAGASLILALAVPERGLGRAVMNRLRKAAAGGEVPGHGQPAGPGGV